MLVLENSTQAQSAFHKELREAVTKHMKDVPAIEMLAVAAHVVGVLVTLQDPKQITTEQAMLVVEFNINKGNEDTVGLLDRLSADPMNQPTQGEA